MDKHPPHSDHRFKIHSESQLNGFPVDDGYSASGDYTNAHYVTQEEQSYHVPNNIGNQHSNPKLSDDGEEGEFFDVTMGDETSVKIKVMGIGGGGSNAVDYMFTKNIKHVDLYCANTDTKHLAKVSVRKKIALGKQTARGFGAGADPNIGRKAAEESLENIKTIIKNANMLFITACLGGGTGTGAAPVIAKAAKEMGILTIAVITLPFSFEGLMRTNNAMEGLKKLESMVDSIIVVHNEKLLSVSNKVFPNISLESAFTEVNKVLYSAVKGISDVIQETGFVNPDFRDVQTIMKEPGMAIMGLSEINDYSNYKRAVEQALKSPLLNDIDLSQVRGVLVNITSGRDIPLNIVYETMNVINAKALDSEHTGRIIWGHVYDDSHEGKMTVAIIASGLKHDERQSYLATSDSYQKMLEAQDREAEEKKENPNKPSFLNNPTQPARSPLNRDEFVNIRDFDDLGTHPSVATTGVNRKVENQKHELPSPPVDLSSLPYFQNIARGSGGESEQLPRNSNNDNDKGNDLDVPSFLKRQAN